MSKDVLNHPHDTFVKEILSKKENAQDFFSNYLPARIRNLLDLDSLEICKDSFVEKELKEYFSDLVYKLNLSGAQPDEHEAGYLYLLFEHKSTPQRWISFHLLRYQVRMWEQYLKQNEKAPKLPVIIPLVLYHGRGRWRLSTQFYDLITPQRPELKAYVPDFSYLLYDLSDYSDAQIIGMAIMRMFLLLLKYIHHPELAKHLEQIFSMLADLSPSEQDEYLATILRYLFNATDEVGVDELKQIVEKNIPKGKNKEGIIMTLAERLIQQGTQQGLQQGVQQGLQQGLQQGVQKSIMDVLEARFGNVTASLRDKLSGISDRATLEDVLRKAATVSSLAELEKNFPQSA